MLGREKVTKFPRPRECGSALQITWEYHTEDIGLAPITKYLWSDFIAIFIYSIFSLYNHGTFPHSLLCGGSSSLFASSLFSRKFGYFQSHFVMAPSTPLSGEALHVLVVDDSLVDRKWVEKLLKSFDYKGIYYFYYFSQSLLLQGFCRGSLSPWGVWP